jgi:hypothetical protein
MMNPQEIGPLIALTLRKMGEETASCNELECGLRGYPYLHKRTPGLFNDRQWEEPIWDGLVHRLRETLQADTEKPYPNGQADFVEIPSTAQLMLVFLAEPLEAKRVGRGGYAAVDQLLLIGGTSWRPHTVFVSSWSDDRAADFGPRALSEFKAAGRSPKAILIFDMRTSKLIWRHGKVEALNPTPADLLHLSGGRRAWPGTRRGKKKCDIVLSINDTELFWIEGKLVMEDYWVWDDTIGKWYWENPAPIYGQWREALADVRGKDLQKLNTLTRSDATYIGILVLGFDRIGGMLEQDDFYNQLPKQPLCTWESFHQHRDGVNWLDHYVPAGSRGFRDRLWFWFCDVKTVK